VVGTAIYLIVLPLQGTTELVKSSCIAG
jgi:hypothetical protein